MRSGFLPAQAASNIDFTSVMDAVDALLTAVVGALIIRSRPRNALGWIILGVGFGLGLSSLALAYAVLGISGMPDAAPGYRWAAWLSLFVWGIPFLGLMLLLLLFPTGRFLTPRWRWVAWFAIIVVVAAMTPLALMTPIEIDGNQIANPLGGFPQDAVLPIVLGAFILWLATLGAALVGLIVRYVRAQRRERQQIKWLMYAAAVFIAAQLFSFFQPTDFMVETGLGQVLVSIAALGFPLAIGIAILRYQLFDIDLVIRKTLVYTVLSGLLALVFLGSVILLQRGFEAVTGQQSQLAIVLSTLAIAALFNPLRGRIQAVIDRRFYRKKYDAQQVLSAFAITARDETDMSALTVELAHVVQNTLEPEEIRVWLRGQHCIPDRLKASDA
jgi:hypothetical protein